MNALTFALRGLWHFRKAHVGTLAGTALGAMVLLGALLAGDSVRYTLLRSAAARIGRVDAVLTGGDRFFRAVMAKDLGEEGVDAAPLLMLRANVSVRNGLGSAGGVNVVGVDGGFPGFSSGGDLESPEGMEFQVNTHLAEVLGISAGDEMVLRFDKPSLVAPDAPLAGKESDRVTIRGTVGAIRGGRDLGGFSLANSQLPEKTVFVPLRRLQEAIGQDGRANAMLMRAARGGVDFKAVVAECCQLEDYGISVREVPLAGAIEIRSSRVFFDREVAAAILKRLPDAEPSITYLANTLAAKGRETPYSMVTAVNRGAAGFPPGDGKGVVIDEWLADDLGAGVGDALRIDYYAIDRGNRLVERSKSFAIAAVVPLTGIAVDRMWMPDFPGVEEAEDAADWDAGVPIDIKRIRDKDEAYWDAYRGAPKLFLPLEDGREMFSNRWGEFTALRVPGAKVVDVARQVREALDPGTVGLVVRNLRADGMAAARSPVDFAGLFLGMSVFLMVSAVALSAMMFRFQVESRNRESGVLAALGVSPRLILRWRLLEGFWVVSVGTLVGALLALGYTRILLSFLDGIWSETGGAGFRFHVSAVTMVSGVVGFVWLMMLVIWRVTREQSRRSASVRVEAGAGEVSRSVSDRVPWLAVGLGLGGLVMPWGSGLLGVSGAFFLGGFLWLVAGLSAYRWVLRKRSGAVGSCVSPKGFAAINCARRPLRSSVVVACLACGVFMVMAVTVFQKHVGDEWMLREGGAGGFAFWVETTAPVNRSERSTDHDPAELGVDRVAFGQIVALRSGPGDDASCFNLNQVGRPRILATDAGVMSRLGAFSIKSVREGLRNDWSVLKDGDVMRGFVDESTLIWVLKRKLGDQLIYQDERGVDFPVEIAGTLDGSVFQGSLVVDEGCFLEKFPGAEGPRIFLIDQGTGDVEPGLERLKKGLADRGAVVETTRSRLAAFHGVENTYISVFQVLGGLGVVLGSAGLGLLTARNMRERRREFAVLGALGVSAPVIRRIVGIEVAHWIRWGLGIGIVAALLPLCVAPSAGARWSNWGVLAILVILVATNAGFWSWIAVRGTCRSLPGAQDEEG